MILSGSVISIIVYGIVLCRSFRFIPFHSKILSIIVVIIMVNAKQSVNVTIASNRIKSIFMTQYAMMCDNGGGDGSRSGRRPELPLVILLKHFNRLCRIDLLVASIYLSLAVGC